MGMSASQARLLSITSRLTNNEFRSQTITNSKLRLAQESADANTEYMDALNSKQLMFGSYGSDGKYTSTALTPALIYDYSPLKNQYALVKPSGKVLVSNIDAKNYENSNNLYEFLGKYNLVENTASYEQYKKDYTDYTSQLTQYYKDKEKYDKDYKLWEEQNNAYQEALGRPDLYTPFAAIVGTSDNPRACYQAAKAGDYNCFTHLLDYLIDYSTSENNGNRAPHNEQTSTGKQFTTKCDSGAFLDSETAENKKMFEKISQNLDSVYCDGHDNDDYKTKSSNKYNLLEANKQEGKTITELDRLRSDYVENQDGTYTLKTLKQKAIDMYYIIQYRDSFKDEQGNTLITKDEMNKMLDNFTDGDMQKLTAKEPESIGKKPEKPQEPSAPAFEVSLTDNDEAQWYVNLWHLMNGSTSSNKVKTSQISYGTIEETVHSVENSTKNSTKANYEVFEDMNLYKNSEWLQFALEHGMVTMSQAQYSNPSADSGKTPSTTSEGITWSSIIYTNASDITSQDNETAIAIAEVKYKNAITEIENKDKKFDQDLKKLDTEHSALQTEYESIKEVISKNTERSFKAFS